METPFAFASRRFILRVNEAIRSDWGSDLYAGGRAVVNTERRQGMSALQAIQTTIDGERLIQPG